mgnify:CR=1 FL=1
MYAYGALTVGLEGKELAEMGLLAEAGAVAFTDGVEPVRLARQRELDVAGRGLVGGLVEVALPLQREVSVVGRHYDFS